MPLVGGDYFIFFQPIFNIADSAISIGVFLALLNYRSLNKELESYQKMSVSYTTNPEVISSQLDDTQPDQDQNLNEEE